MRWCGAPYETIGLVGKIAPSLGSHKKRSGWRRCARDNASSRVRLHLVGYVNRALCSFLRYADLPRVFEEQSED